MVNVLDNDVALADERPIPLGRMREDAKGPAAQPVEPDEAAGPLAIALVPHQAAPAAAERAGPMASPPDGHPLAALAGFRFRLEVTVVKPPRSGRPPGLGRWLLAYAVVMTLILGLIAAFVALIARTPAMEVTR